MAFPSMVPQTKAAHTKSAIERPGPAAQRTTIVLPDFELVRSFSFNPQTLFGQWTSPRAVNQLANGIPIDFSKALPSGSVFAEVFIVTVIPRALSTLSAEISGKMICSRNPRE